MSCEWIFLVCNFDLYRQVRVVRTGPLGYRYADHPLSGGITKIDHRRSIKGEIDRRRSIEGEKRKKKKKKRERRKKYLALFSPARRRRQRVAHMP
ncbi:hypothetical protein BHM03_00057378 [Ensete ventricosum]|nr:hypothetical protein BHM03_00057378 [Ensete ventricosum]